MGQFSNPADTRHVGDILEGRLQRILNRYLTRLSPLGDVRVEGDATLCAVDTARLRYVREDASFRYTTRTSSGALLPTTPGIDGSLCVTLPPLAETGSYLVVSIMNGVAPGPLAVHLAAGASGRGYRVIGIERMAGVP
jgi:hypothetical protein